MGTVWRATDTVLGRDVAVKEVTFPRGVTDEEREVLRERTRREARAAARLDHPSAVTVYDVAEEDGTPYLVMELVEARTLSEVVRTDGPLGPRDAAKMGLAVLGALQAAHAEGIVHRDVKPGNVLLRPDGRVVLTDFGIATFTGDSSITSTGLLLGSPSYIAPERARGESPGPASDLWSLGATMFTAVEGSAPFDKGEPLPTMTAVVTGEHEPFVSAGPLIPVLEGLLEKDPTLRMDAATAVAALTEVIESAGDEADLPAATAPTAPLQRAERTTALSLGDVQHDVAAEQVASATPRPRTYAPPRPVPRQRRRSRTPAVLTALALLVAGGLGLGLSGALRDGESKTPAAGGAASSRPSDGASDGATGAGGGAVDAPAGWQSFPGAGGWTVAVPPSYALGSFDRSPQYKDSATGRTLRVTTGKGGPDAVEDRRIRAGLFAKSHDAYNEIGINPVEYRGYEAADWEFTYSDGGASLHAISRVFVVDKTGYSIFFQTRATDDWAAARKDFDQIAASFRTA